MFKVVRTHSTLEDMFVVKMFECSQMKSLSSLKANGWCAMSKDIIVGPFPGFLERELSVSADGASHHGSSVKVCSYILILLRGR